jgi:hypothetical protein
MKQLSIVLLMFWISLSSQAHTIKRNPDGTKALQVIFFDSQNLNLRFEVENADLQNLEWIQIVQPALPFLCQLSYQNRQRGADVQFSLDFSGITCTQSLLKFIYKGDLLIQYRKAGGSVQTLTLNEPFLNECSSIESCEDLNPLTAKVPLKNANLKLESLADKTLRFMDTNTEKIWGWDLQYDVDLQSAYLLCGQTLGRDFKLPAIDDLMATPQLAFVFEALQLSGNYWTSTTTGNPKMAWVFNPNSISLVPITARNKVLCLKKL